jgi:hypothetical protein
MKHRQPERELPFAASAFNLFGETGDDPLRLMRERDAKLAAAHEAERYQARMQRVFADCPGFIGGDVPKGPQCSGRVVVEPSRSVEALNWLKRRFYVNESLELDRVVEGLAFEIKPRQRSHGAGGKRIKVTFARPEQFPLAL